MESEFEKKLKDVQPKSLTDDERGYLWTNIREGITVEKYILAHKQSRFGRFNIFKNVGWFGWFKFNGSGMFGRRAQFRLVAAAAIVALVFGGSSATIALADNSLPGDFLYPVNLAVENARIHLASSPDQRDELRLQFASKRLEEVKELLARAGVQYTILADEASSTATSTDSTSNNDMATSTDNTASSTNDTNNDSAESTSTATSTATSTNASDDNSGNDQNNAPALTQANNAFVTALDYLNKTKAQMVSDGNTAGVAVIDAFIQELTVLANNHVQDIEHSHIVSHTGGNNTHTNIAIQASIDKVKTKFKFDESTSADGRTRRSISLNDGTNTLSYKDDGNRVSSTTDSEDQHGKKNENKKDKHDDYRHYVPPSISICVDGSVKSVKPDEIAGYLKNGASLGSCKKHGDEQGENEEDDTEHGRGQQKVEVCHNGNTITIAKPAEWAHLKQGDTEGACGSDQGGGQNDVTPPVISNITAASGTSTATIAWQTDENAKSVLWYGTSNVINTSGAHKNDDTLKTAHSMTLSGLTASTTYYFRIDATDAAGNTATSSVRSFTTEANIDTTPPVVSGITIHATTTSATAAWNTNENATGVIWYGTSSPLVLADAAHKEDTTLGTTHGATMPSLTPDTTYYYLIVATDASGNVSTSTEDSFATPALPDTTPPTVSGLSTTTDTISAQVTFTTDEPAKSTLWYSTTSPVPIGATKLTYPSSGYATSHTFSLTSLTPGVTYYFLIQVVDQAGNSRFISEGNLTTLPLPDTTPPVISGINTNVANTSADIIFTTDEDAIGTVWYGTTTPLTIDGTTAFEKDTSVTTNHTISLSGLEASTTYYFIVGAADTSNNTSTSSESSFTTP